MPNETKLPASDATQDNFYCQECGKKFRTVAAAMRAQSVGCPKCNSGDIDLGKPVAAAVSL